MVCFPPSLRLLAAVLLSEGILLSPTVGLIWDAMLTRASTDSICNRTESEKRVYQLDSVIQNTAITLN